MTWRVRGTVLDVLDGDTVRLDLDLGWRTWLKSEPCRLDGIDAPELPTESGKAAREYLRKLLPPGEVVWVEGTKRDKFGRILIKITCELGDVGTIMIDTGHAVEYHGGTR